MKNLSLGHIHGMSVKIGQIQLRGRPVTKDELAARPLASTALDEIWRRAKQRMQG